MIAGLVSTIIPVFNRGRMLREAVDSVLAQTWRPIEIVIVDDGSTDDTAEVMAELQSSRPGLIRLHRQENAGPGVAREAGLQLANGEFIQFLDSDDLLLPDKFRLQVEGLRTDLDAGISYGKTYASNGGTRLAQPAQHTGERHRTLFPALLKEPLWPTLTPLYRRSILDSMGPWPRGRQLEDWIYDAQAAALGVQLHYCEDYIAETRNHDEGRLCHLWQTDTGAMRDRISAYVTVLGLAQRAGLARESAPMQEFARSLFWMARSAGSYGLDSEARELFRLARELQSGPGIDYAVFRAAAALLGWKRASRLAESVRSRRP